MENHFLQVREISVFYGDMQALWDISFFVPKGSIVTLVGANGSGKTTTLRTISGIIKPRKGEILFLGRDLTKIIPQQIVELGISHVPEGRHIFSKLTVFENLRIGAYIERAKKNFEESLRRVYRLFPILEERKNQLAGSLSGGEQQMLAIGRALMAEPQLLMLDEPSLGLAPMVVRTLFELFLILKEQGTTILLVEQNVFQALKIADYAYVLKNGRIIMEGKGEELLKNPEIQAAYIGKRATTA